jgi:hypothetical protein
MKPSAIVNLLGTIAFCLAAVALGIIAISTASAVFAQSAPSDVRHHIETINGIAQKGGLPSAPAPSSGM